MKEVDIKYACDEQWSSMKDIEKGAKLCDKCNIKVSDFSNGNKRLNIENNSCGRFNLNQVRKVQKNIHIPKVGYYAASLMSIFGITVLNNSALAQTQEDKPTQVKSTVGSVKISGTIRNPYDYSRIPYVQIQVILNEGVITESKSSFKGTFEITVDTLDLNFNELQLVFSVNEFESDTLQTKTITKSMLSNGLNVELESVYDCFKPKNNDNGIFVTGKTKQEDHIYQPPPLTEEK